MSRIGNLVFAAAVVLCLPWSIGHADDNPAAGSLAPGDYRPDGSSPRRHWGLGWGWDWRTGSFYRRDGLGLQKAASASAPAACREAVLLEKANVVLNKHAARPVRAGILMALLRNAQGVAIFPCLIKAGMLVGGRHGLGVLLTREADGSWGPPVFLKLSAASAGFQFGVEGSDLVLVFRTRSSLECLQKGKLTLELDKMAAIGPLGVESLLGTDVRLQTCIVSSLSRGKGLFAGVCVEGAFLRIDSAATDAYGRYEQGCLQNGGPTAPPSLRLQMTLAALSAPAASPAAPSGPQP